MSWHGLVVPYEDRSDWLEKRRSGVGASDVAGILGLSPYSTPFTVWAEKRHNYEKDVTDAMHFGKVLEDVIVTELEERAGLSVQHRELLVRHPDDEWAMATVDGLAFESPVDNDPDDALGLVEIKTDGSFGRWVEVPDRIQLQVQWQMMVTGLDYVFLAVLHGGRRFELYEVVADPHVQQLARDRVVVFREKYLLDPDAEPPEVDASPATTRVISDLWSDPSDEEIDLSPQMHADVMALRGLKAERKRIEGLVKEMENRVKVSLQEATVGRWQGAPMVTFKQQTMKEHVRKESTFRVLRIVEQKEDNEED